MLGVIIGVAAVVATLAIGQGARASVQAQIATLGSNVIMIMPGAPSAGGVRMVMGSGSTFTAEDVDAIRRECPSVSAVTWTVRSGGQAVYGNQNWSTSIVGATADYFPIREWTIADGTAFTDERRAQRGEGRRARARPWPRTCSRAGAPSARRSASRTCRSRWSR
jgi:ABC-type antimicrobial peptide transport system permease subunit